MAVQKLLDARGTTKRLVDGKRQSSLTRKYPLPYMVKCSYCGGTYTRRHWHNGPSYDKIMWQCVNNTKNGTKACSHSKEIPGSVLDGASIGAYNEIVINKKSTFDGLYEDIKNRFGEESLEELIRKNEKKLSALEAKRKKLVDLNVEDGISEEVYSDVYEKLTGKINAIDMNLEKLKEDQTKRNEMEEKLASIKELFKNGNTIKEFDTYLFNALVDRVEVEDGDDHYKIKFFFKTKQRFDANAMEYILKEKHRRFVNGILYLKTGLEPEKETLQNGSDAC